MGNSKSENNPIKEEKSVTGNYGNNSSSDRNEFGKNNVDDEFFANDKKPKLLCLHGWRTSGKILSFQTAALQYHANIKCSFLDAPWSSEGPPDTGISKYYPDEKYYEWYYKRDIINDDNELKTVHCEGLEESLEFIINEINNNGPYDGLLGFSQGSGMVTRLAQLLNDNDIRFIHKQPFKFVVLIGGIPPRNNSQVEYNDRVKDSITAPSKLLIPNLHIIGRADPLLPLCQKLLGYYDDSSRSELYHEEGHNIPSIRTGLYPSIRQWIKAKSIF
eukprot:gene9677-13030_t